jgi:hypothetical protein
MPTPDDVPARRSLWSRSLLALAFALYGWSMLGIELYLVGAPLAEGPDRGLTLFRRLVMGRAVVAVGGAAVLAAIILAALGLRARRDRTVTGLRVLAVLALVASAAWLLCLSAIWPI